MIGSRAFVVGDGGSPWARRQRDLIALHVADLGGEEALSENQLSLCRRAATIETELEMLEGKLSMGQDADLDLYNRLSGNLRRICESLGLKRISKVVDLSAQDRINQYWDRKRARGLAAPPVEPESALCTTEPKKPPSAPRDSYPGPIQKDSPDAH